MVDRLLTYLEAYASPRRSTGTPGDRRPYDQQLGHAFAAFLESVDPGRMPLHGGDATTVMVTIDLDLLRDGLGTALVGDTPISAGEARRLACTANILPAVLGGTSEILDLGRARRLFSPAQRKAMAIRDAPAAPRAATSPPPGAKPTTPPDPGPPAAGPTSPTDCSSAPGTTTAPTTTATTPAAYPPEQLRFHRRT